MSEEKKHKIDNELDWIDYPKYKNSIKNLIDEKYPNGAPNDVIAKSLNMSEAEVEELYQSAIKKLQAELL